MDFVDLIRLDGAVQVSGGVAGGPHAAFADDAAERTLGRIVYRRGETSEVMASIDLEFSSRTSGRARDHHPAVRDSKS